MLDNKNRASNLHLTVVFFMPVCEVTGSRVTRGNNVPKSNKKTRKTIKNSVTKRAYISRALGIKVVIKCTKRASDTIIRAGGIDCYVLNSNTSSLSNEMQTLAKRIRSSMKKKDLCGKTPEELQFV